MVSSGRGSPTLPTTRTTKMAAWPECPTNWWRSLTKRKGGGGSPAVRTPGDDAHVSVLLEEGVADVPDRDHPVVPEGGPEIPRAQALPTPLAPQHPAVPAHHPQARLLQPVCPL